MARKKPAKKAKAKSGPQEASKEGQEEGRARKGRRDESRPRSRSKKAAKKAAQEGRQEGRRKAAKPAARKAAKPAKKRVAAPPRRPRHEAGRRRQRALAARRSRTWIARARPWPTSTASRRASTWTAAPSAAKSGRAELKDRLSKNTSASPALTAGDVDADWESAESVGDEAPGGDNPTPDQDVVDDIGRALGVEYEDDEELQGGAEIADRDRHRWELDPASKDDFDEDDE